MNDGLEEIRKRIFEKKEKLGLSYQDLQDKTGVNKSTLQRYMTGYIGNIGLDKIEALAEALKTTPSYLMGWDEETIFNRFSNLAPIGKKRFKVLGTVQCGLPSLANEEKDLYIDITTNIDADFILYAKGDSMINARVKDGDIVFVKSCSMVDNGDIAVVVINDEATLKRVFYNRESNKLVLQAENPDYEPLVYVNEELNDIRIIGKAIAFQSDL